jgi:hypothetical protein
MLCSLHQGKSTSLGVPIIPGLNTQVQAFLDRSESNFVVPREAYRITDFMSAIYVQMVFGLKTSSVKSIMAGFCPTVLTAFNLLAQEWEQMANDIRNATLKPSLNLTESQRITLEEALGDGDPQRADQLIEIMSESVKCVVSNQSLISYGPILPALLPLQEAPLQLTSPRFGTI